MTNQDEQIVEETKAVEAVEVNIEALDIHIDVESLTLDDLELLSVMAEGTDEDRAEIPGFRIIQFLKRVGGAHLGKRPQGELQAIITEISKQINAYQNPTVAGKN